MSSGREGVEAIVETELRHVLGADRVIEGSAVLVEVGVTSLKLLELSARVGLRLGLAGDPPSTSEIRTLRDFIEVFERHLAEPRQDDLALGASVNRAQRRLRLRGSNR
jgi:acyl carrier protein